MLDELPELANIARLDAVKIGNMFSDDIRPQHWNIMAEACMEAFADGCHGVVIAHGTDTLHITSAALNFAFSGKGERPPGCIAMVGSQRSSDRGSSDAAENLLAAVHWAATGPAPTGNVGDSVVVVMHDTSSDGVMAIHSGLAVRKMHSSRRDAFQPVNAQPLANITITPEGATSELLPWYEKERQQGLNRPVVANASSYIPTQRIAQFIAGPWLHSEHIEAVVNTGVQGVVIHGTGLGHLPIDDPQGDAPENTLLWRALAVHQSRIAGSHREPMHPWPGGLERLFQRSKTAGNGVVGPRHHFNTRDNGHQIALGSFPKHGHPRRHDGKLVWGTPRYPDGVGASIKNREGVEASWKATLATALKDLRSKRETARKEAV